VVALISISIAPTASTIGVAATQQYTATGYYPDGATVDITSSVIWSSNDTSVATINNSGLVTGIAIGLTTITANTVSNISELKVSGPIAFIANKGSNTIIINGACCLE
jgi:uncharacterized protein YjdB